jgi:GNAT superfamily N-acetyltransferase
LIEIIPASRSDSVWIADLIGSAFHHLGVAQWLVPDPVERARILPRNVAIYVDYGIAYGEAQVTSERSAVAVWVPRGGRELPPPEDYERRLADACGAWTDRFAQLDALFEVNTPPKPHHHLAFLAVRPDRQGAGLGSALLERYHARLDRIGEPAFLEASSPGSRRLYLRHGYRDIAEPYIVGDGAQLWPMWRDARVPVA